MSSIFLSVSRSKRSIAIDLATERGREVLLGVAGRADVFVHSMRPQAIGRLGLTYADIAAVRPQIVYCNALGFGRDGRYGGRPAYDDVVQGATGFAAAQARLAGEPQYVASPIADKTAGLMAATAILAALHHRALTGEGQEVDVPMFETMASYFLVEHLYGEVFDPPIGPPGYPRLISPFRRPYPTRDGYLCVLLYNDKQWLRFFELIGRTDVLEDARFRTIAARTDNTDALYALLASEMRHRSTTEWLELLGDEIPAAPLADTMDLLSDPHLADVGFFRTLEHPSEGSIRTTAFPVRFSSVSTSGERPAPRLGEHTAQILLESGLASDEVDQLVRERIVVRAPQPS